MAQSALKTCEICISAPGSEYCLDCEQYFCGSCKSLHKRQNVTRNHEFQSGSDIIQEVRRKCHEHNEELIFLCKNCDQPVCVKCITGKHNGHTLSDVTESISQLKETVRKEISVINTNLQKQEQGLKTFDLNVTSVIKQITEEGTKIKAMIDRNIRSMIESLEAKAKLETVKITWIINYSKKHLEETAIWLEQNERELQRRKGDSCLIQQLKSLNADFSDLSVDPFSDIPAVKYNTMSVSDGDIKQLIGSYDLRMAKPTGLGELHRCNGCGKEDIVTYYELPLDDNVICCENCDRDMEHIDDV